MADDNLPEGSTPLSSWYAQMYPPHECQQCKLQHTNIPTIVNQQGIVLIPIEIVGTLHGPYKGPAPYDTPAYIHALFLGIPGSRKPFLTGMISCN